MSKHTPGPWVIRYTDAVYAQSGRFIADCELTPYDARPQPPNSTDAANAHLIAAAPAMYEALLLAMQALEELAQHPAFEGDAEEFNAGGYGYIALSKAQTALAQAEGRG